MDSLSERLDKLKQLPAHPGVLVELSLALSDAEADSADIERIVSLDTALAVTILREANSAAYGAAEPTSSLQDAVTRLGKRDLLRIAAGHDCKGPLDEAGKSYGLQSGEVWEAARAGAVVASFIAERCKLADPRVTFTAALLRDCGKLAMDHLLESGELEKLLVDRERRSGVLDLEREAFGFDHAEVGAELAARWGLSSELSDAIRYHHSPPKDCKQPLVDIVHCADALCAMLGLGVGLDGLAYSLDTDARERIGLDLEEMQVCLADLAEHLSGLQKSPSAGDA